MEVNKIYQGDSLEVLKTFPNESINCVMTSPPYWALRDYQIKDDIIWGGNKDCEHIFQEQETTLHYGESSKQSEDKLLNKNSNPENKDHQKMKSGFCSKCNAWKGQLGLEPTFDLYIKHLCDIFDEVKRVLRKDGTCWINLGDTYASTPAGNKEIKFEGDGVYGRLMKRHTNNGEEEVTPKPKEYGLPNKSLCNIPARFSIEMQNRGWILRNVIIWHKPNCMPSSVKDRFTVDFEYIFFFVKNKKYFFETQYENLADSSLKDNRLDKGLVPHKKGKSFDKELFEKNSMDKKLFHKQDLVGNPTYTGFNKRWQEREIPYSVQPRDKDFVEYRNLPDLKEFSNYINSARKELEVSIEEVEEQFGNQKPHHWFNAESYPSPEDYKILKSKLELDDTYDEQMLETFTKSSEKQYAIMGTSINSCGRNKRTVWRICPQPFKESHFAVYPEELCEIPIRAGCPEFICNKCGKPREKILEPTEEYKKILEKNKINGVNSSERRKQAMQLGNAFYENKIKTNADYVSKGYTSCSCNEGFHSGIILDPFFGAGTTGLVALKQNKGFIGIELNPKYIEIAERRLKPYLEQTKLI